MIMKWITGGNAMEIGELLRPGEVVRTFLILDAERKRWSGIPPPRSPLGAMLEA
jgi:hypothetical protein